MARGPPRARVPLGQTMHDSATVSNGGFPFTGTMTFEFFQNKVSLCATASCSTFVGARKVNDVIVSMDYLQGGSLGSVTVRKWDGSDYVLQGTAGGEGCFTSDEICAFNNGGSAAPI